MKNLILFSIALCFIVSAASAQPAQLQKGTIMTGVTSSMSMCGSWDSQLFGLWLTKTKYTYGSTTTDSHSALIYNLLPRAGYFFIENLAGGIGVVLSGARTTDADDSDKYKESMIGIGPFVRYYYPLEKLYPFAEAEMLVGSWSAGDPDDSPDKEGFFMFGIYLGASYPLGEKVTFDGLIGYSRAQWSWDAYEGEGTTKSTEGGLAIRAGFTVYLR